MSVLTKVISRPAPSSPKGIIYADAGAGKSTFGGSPQDSLLIDCENGAGTIQCQRTPYLETWQEIDQYLKALANESHPYKVVTIDTVDWLIRRIEEQVTGKELTQTLNKSHGGYGNGRCVLRNYIYQVLLPTLNKIVNKGCALILLAHAKRDEHTDISGVTVEKALPDLPADCLNIFVEWADFVCMAEVIQGKRYLVTGTESTTKALVKNRYNMPATIDFNWPAFTAAVNAGLNQKFKKEEK